MYSGRVLYGVSPFSPFVLHSGLDGLWREHVFMPRVLGKTVFHVF